jgi:hypothetical protein
MEASLTNSSYHGRVRHIVVRALALALVGISLFACTRQSQQPDPAPGIQGNLRVEPQPPTMGSTELVITLTGANGAPLEEAKVSVRGDMNHAGMVPVFGSAEETEPGVYRAPFRWTMGGDWTVTVIIEMADGTEAERTFPVTVDAGAG